MARNKHAHHRHNNNEIIMHIGCGAAASRAKNNGNNNGAYGVIFHRAPALSRSPLLAGIGRQKKKAAHLVNAVASYRIIAAMPVSNSAISLNHHPYHRESPYRWRWRGGGIGEETVAAAATGGGGGGGDIKRNVGSAIA
jgi:hypothetical protein